MSAYSTRTITRERAEEMAVRLLAQKLAEVHRMSDNELEHLLDDITDECLTNYSIGDDYLK